VVSNYIRPLKVSYIEQGNKLVVSGRKKDSVVAPVGVQDHPTLRLLGYFKAPNDLFVLQRPYEELITYTSRCKKLIIGIERKAENRGPIIKIKN
jgi:hypothetical protein